MATPLEVAQRGAATHRLPFAATGEEKTTAPPLEVARLCLVVHRLDGAAAAWEEIAATPLEVARRDEMPTTWTGRRRLQGGRPRGRPARRRGMAWRWRNEATPSTTWTGWRAVAARKETKAPSRGVAIHSLDRAAAEEKIGAAPLEAMGNSGHPPPEAATDLASYGASGQTACCGSTRRSTCGRGGGAEAGGGVAGGAGGRGAEVVGDAAALESLGAELRWGRLVAQLAV